MLSVHALGEFEVLGHTLLTNLVVPRARRTPRSNRYAYWPCRRNRQIPLNRGPVDIRVGATIHRVFAPERHSFMD